MLSVDAEVVRHNQTEAGLTTLSFQQKCELWSKRFAVLLAFMVPVSTTGTYIALFSFIIAWLLAGNLQKKTQPIWTNPIAHCVFLLFALFMIGTLYSVAPSHDMTRFLGKMSKLLYLPILLTVMQETKWRKYAIMAFLSAMILTFALSLVKVYGEFPIFQHKNFTHACIFRDHIFTNLMMSFASFILAHQLFSESEGPKRFLLVGLLLGLIYYVFFMSEGRTGYFVFAALCVLWCLQRLKWKGLVSGFLILVLVIGAATLIKSNFQNRLLRAVENFEQYKKGDIKNPVGARLDFYQQTWQLIKERPWFGYGTGSFKAVYQEHARVHNLPIYNSALLADNPHNEYLNIMLPFGIVGLMVFLGFFVTLFLKSFALPEPEKWLAQGLGVAMLVGCVANSWMMDFTSGYFFVVLIAVCFAALKSTQKELE